MATTATKKAVSKKTTAAKTVTPEEQAHKQLTLEFALAAVLQQVGKIDDLSKKLDVLTAASVNATKAAQEMLSPAVVPSAPPVTPVPTVPRRKYARDMAVGATFKPLGRVHSMIRVKPTGFLLNSTVIQDALVRGDILVFNVDTGTVWIMEGDREVL